MLKKLVGVLVVAFVAFYLFTEPQASADAVRRAVAVVGDAFGAMVTFLSALFR
jgi:hypothetical protein